MRLDVDILQCGDVAIGGPHACVDAPRQGENVQIAGFRSLPVAPILKPEPADANEFPRIVGYDLEPPPQGTSR
jgi:hypothetical protein